MTTKQKNMHSHTSGWLITALLASMWLLGGMPGAVLHAAESIKVGLTYPNTGRYKDIGIDQARGALLAIEEINQVGGVMGRPIELVIGHAGREGKEQQQVKRLLSQGVDMAFGSSLKPAVTADAAAKANMLYFDTLFHSPDERVSQPTVFYESYDSWMAAKTLAFYMNQSLRGQKLFYITSDNPWGTMTESILRKFTNSRNIGVHGQSSTRFPSPRRKEFLAAFQQAKEAGAKVLVLVQYGDDLAKALHVAYEAGLTAAMQIVAPNITLSVARSVGADVLEGVVGTVPWSWQVARDYRYGEGIRFTDTYVDHFQTKPSAAAASAYTTVWQYKRAVEKAGSLDARTVARQLSGHTYSGQKDPQTWRKSDHLSIQSVYVVKGKPREQVMQGELREDYFQVMSNVAGQIVALTPDEVAQRAWDNR